MKPYVRRGVADPYWYVDTNRDDGVLYPGTAWGGYDTMREAFDAAVIARMVLEPS
ncbi:hypothetical protein SOM10_12070 [Microbacterium sp. CFBP9023]|uniref:hypothetical protein n=1 Tax=Microbacterium sp. CFBP9023 TaxID=3096535 RepID=UPI002A6B169C|nr:hypothetical protein [Microbacterium sp. CFBP9023]MDY0984632.1 hypothetical protein [Microbacterium sp. CFBP9023]